MAEKLDSKGVVARLEEAAKTLERLPDEKVHGYRSSWPEMIPDWERYGWSKVKVRPGPPTPAAIDRMDECLSWFRFLEPGEVRLVWARACRINWKLISRHTGMHRSTAWRYWTVAILKITARLEVRGKSVATS